MRTFTKFLTSCAFLFIATAFVYSQDAYVTVEGYEGNYEDEAAWISVDGSPAWPAENQWQTADPTRPIVISANSKITYDYSRDLGASKIYVYGTFIVKTGYYNNTEGGLTIKAGGVVEIEGELGGPESITVEEGALLILKGGANITGGNFNVSGNVVAQGTVSLNGNGFSVSETGVFVFDGEVLNQYNGTIINDGKIYVTQPEFVYNSNDGLGVTEPDFSNGGASDIIVDQESNSILLGALGDLDIVEQGPSTKANVASKEFEVSINSNSLTVKSENSSVVAIYTVSGEKVLTINLSNGVNNINLPAKTGVYIVKVVSGKDVFVEKIIK